MSDGAGRGVAIRIATVCLRTVQSSVHTPSEPQKSFVAGYLFDRFATQRETIVAHPVTGRRRDLLMFASCLGSE